MFRTARTSLLRRSLDEGARRKGHSVMTRCISQEPLSSPNGSYAARFPPLLHPLPELKIPPCLPDYLERCPTKITTLPNGLKIASENCPGPAACIGLYVDCGSIYEKEESIGISHLLERLSFKSTKNRSHLRIVREIEAAGGHVAASASREQMGYTYDTLKTHLPKAIEILIDCVRNPVFIDNEVKEQVDKVKIEIEQATNNPQEYLMESLHPTGYTGSLSNPLVAPLRVLDKIDGSVIQRFYHENYTADRMVLAAYGVDHEELLAIAEPLLYDLPRGLSLDVTKSTYVGGDFRQHEDAENTHVALAFEVPGGWHHDKDATTLIVIQTLMGGGGSFSTGGPGKGMHSRLYLRVLNEYRQVETFSAFSSVYNETGIFGIHCTTGSDFVARAVEIAAKELLAIATPGQVSDVEFRRAKNATKSAILMTLESRMIATEDIGRQILTHGCWKPVEHFLRCLEELSLDDVTNLAQRMLLSPLTMACLGDVDRVPSCDSVNQQFQSVR